MSSSGSAGQPAPLPVRVIAFEYPDDVPIAWNAWYPEMACVANSISLLMPYLEPFFVKSIRGTLDELDDALRARTEDYLRQELQHHRQHRRFNDLLVAQCPPLHRLERWYRRTFNWMGRRCSSRFNVAFAAGLEGVAFGIARWIDGHADELFSEADPVVSTLFLWHLAEEIEHKTAAFEVFEATDGNRLRLTWATVVALVLLLVFTVAGSLTMLWSQRRLRYPVTWFRLIKWALSLSFTVLPVVAASCLPSHHPDDLTDPPFLTQMLRGFDHDSGTMPLWRGAPRSAGPHEPPSPPGATVQPPP